jgi:hypothetical protein
VRTATEPTEAQFQKQVIGLAHLLGYRVAHFRPAMNARGGWRTAVAGDGKGFPDLVLVGRGRVVYAELKVGRNKLTAEQRGWFDALVNAGQECFEWRPSDWDDIRDLLEGGP